ncbi:MAG TPA: MFS transporter [Phycisphaerae bacterium]|nr:MFS transporter [Phycisphaerae bacterium]
MSNEPTKSKLPDATTHPPGFRARRGINWFMLGLMYASYYTCRYNLSVVAPRIIDYFGFSNAEYGMINTARHWCYAFGQFWNGLLTDRLGGKQAMAIGAVLTIILNIAFGMASYAGAGSVLMLFIIIRGCDGYAQAFGAPGMIKVNTSWFPRSERGRFAGVFGLMIQLGQITIFNLGPILLAGCVIPLGFIVLRIPENHPENFRWLFWIPPVIVAVVVVLMYAIVRNQPEEAGYSIRHDDAETLRDGDHDEKIPLGVVFRTIFRTKMVWVTACAYFCTGVVRTAQYDWWVIYFEREWGLDIKVSTLVIVTGALLPISAFVGSIGSGFISDLFFKGARAPVATVLYAIETAVILLSAVLLTNPTFASAPLAAGCMILISITCNSTHSILGTAAAMDLGGRKMAGFAAGVIDSFQYIGAGFAGFGLGKLIDHAIANWAIGWGAWFYFMAPFSAIGTLLMAYVWYTTRGKEVTGA